MATNKINDLQRKQSEQRLKLKKTSAEADELRERLAQQMRIFELQKVEGRELKAAQAAALQVRFLSKTPDIDVHNAIDHTVLALNTAECRMKNCTKYTPALAWLHCKSAAILSLTSLLAGY